MSKGVQLNIFAGAEWDSNYKHWQAVVRLTQPNAVKNRVQYLYQSGQCASKEAAAVIAEDVVRSMFSNIKIENRD